MKNKFALLIASLFLLISSYSFAEPLPRRTFEIGPEIYNFVYEEPTVNVKDEGMMIGVKTSWSYHNRYMLRAEGRVAWGEVDYSSGGTGSADNIQQTAYEGRLLAGWDFVDEEDKLYTVYSGFGYNRLEVDFGGIRTTTGHRGYDRVANYYYLPLGIEGTVNFQQGWNIAANIELDILLSGTQKSMLSQVGGPYRDVTNDQNGGYGLRGSLKFMRYSEKYDISLEPYFRLWRIENSEVSTSTPGNTVNLGLEPKNETNELGVGLSLMF